MTPFQKQRLTPAELAEEITYRIEERLAIAGYITNTPDDVTAACRNEVWAWAFKNYPVTYSKLKLEQTNNEKTTTTPDLFEPWG